MSGEGQAAAAGILVPGADERRIVQLCLSVMGVLGTCSLIGVAFWLYLVNHWPLLLLALSPLGRHMWLVAPTVNPVAFVVVLLARRMAFYLASFHLGRALGPAGIEWVERRAGRFAPWVRWVERGFARWSYPVVFLMTGPTVSGLAGVSGMRQRTFLALATPGLLLRLLAVLYLAEWIRDYIETVLSWIDEVWIPGTVVMVVGVLLYSWKRRPSPIKLDETPEPSATEADPSP